MSDWPGTPDEMAERIRELEAEVERLKKGALVQSRINLQDCERADAAQAQRDELLEVLREAVENDAPPAPVTVVVDAIEHIEKLRARVDAANAAIAASIALVEVERE